jgi:2-furoyl-CoA dehydrogenase FAD binding subunit
LGRAVKPAPFDYLCPSSLDEALVAVAKYGADGRVVAGGQSLGAMLNMRIVKPGALIDINRLQELADIATDGGVIVTGAMVRQADALADARLRADVPLLTLALPHVGHYQTRNRGTLGGSVAHADPSAEIPLALAVLDGEVELRTQRRRRRLKAAQFFQSALVTAREPDEVVTALRWPRAAAGSKFAFVEFAVRDGDYAIVAVACAIDADANGKVRLGFGGCGDAPQVVTVPRTALNDMNDRVVETVASDAAAKIECRSDLLGTSDYRRQLARVLACRALRLAHAQGQRDA